MASTYSPSLRIELIGTGDQSGTWGDTTNTNLGSLIEQAITGYQSITMTDTDYTLTVFNGSPDQSRNAVIEMVSSGSLSTTRNVFVPASEKVYIFKNSTSGGQSIVVKTSSGTGITVPNGKTVFMYCNSVNMYPAQNYFDSISLGTPVPIGSGGTGQTTAVAAFDALAPTTTLGDTVYNDGSHNVRLAGNTTTTKNFLAQTGTGSVSAAPAWSTVSKNDVGLGNVENTALSTWAGSTNLTTLGTIGTGVWQGSTVGVGYGGTGQTSYTNGQILVGKTDGSLAKTTITGGTNITVVNGDGSITISSSNSGGTVTSVGLSMPAQFTVTNSPVTTTGSLTADWASQTQNYVLASPNGSSGTPTFRALVAADIPTLNQNTTGTASNVTGTVAVANGGTGATTAAGARTALSVPSTTGSGASGTWSINVSGSAASATSATSATQLATASGSAPSYSARAWVLFNGTGTISITGSGNVSTIGDNAAGDYTVNFSTSMPDATYATSATIETIANGTNFNFPGLSASTAQTSSLVRVVSAGATSSLRDSARVCVAIFR